MLIKFPTRHRPELPVSEAEQDTFLWNARIAGALNFAIFMCVLILCFGVIITIASFMGGL